MEGCKLGSELPRDEQRYVLEAFGNRYTADRRPLWAREKRPCGRAYLPHFKDDADWLANTFFVVTKSGRLDRRFNHCFSYPTLPLE